MTETIAIIRINGAAADIFFPPASARGIQTSISLVPSGDMRRTVNGSLVDLTRPALRKYLLSMSADGQALPALAGLWRGMRCTVAPPLYWTAQAPAGATELALDRTAADVRAFDAVTLDALPAPSLSADRRVLTFPALPRPAYFEYQPVFEALLSSRSDSGDEWEATATWSLEFEEV
jgi:hypothetical protein